MCEGYHLAFRGTVFVVKHGHDARGSEHHTPWSLEIMLSIQCYANVFMYTYPAQDTLTV
jgi:hypothetical protein